MNVQFTFEENKILSGIVSFGGEWPFPILPRVGEEISPSLLMDWITPAELYDALSDEEKVQWVNWVTEDVEAGSKEEEAQADNLHIWLAKLGTEVSDVCWSKFEGEYFVQIVLKHH